MLSLLSVMQQFFFKAIAHLADSKNKLQLSLKEEDTFYKIQRMMRSLNYHAFAIDFLHDAHFAFTKRMPLSAAEPAHASVTKSLSSILRSVFGFLSLFCSANHENTHLILEHLPIFRKYLPLPCVG